MKYSLIKGFSFGLTSAIITTLGLMIGLYSATSNKLVVIAGILSIAIADSFSDALGIHISEESINKSDKHIWEATLSTLFSKFGFALLFLIPVLLFSLKNAIIISIIISLFALSCLSYKIALRTKDNPVTVILEHIVIAIVVIFVTYYVGKFTALLI